MNREKESLAASRIPSLEEKYKSSAVASLAIHGILIFLIIYGGRLIPQTAITLGSGAGGGTGGDTSTVGVVEELSGGAGMVKPAMLPQPPALEKAPVEKTEKAIPLPGTQASVKKLPTSKSSSKTVTDMGNTIPTAPEPGSGGIAGVRGGAGGGSGGGIGISIGAGAGGFGNSLYARAVEFRISSNWMRPPEGMRIEMTYSFFIAANGTIYGIKQEKSSGNSQIDLTAVRAINASSPLTPPPAEFRGRPIQFVAQFVHPPVP